MNLLMAMLLSLSAIPNYQPSDFYRYDESGLVQGLVLTPKFAVFFDKRYPSEENVDYFALFNDRIAEVINIDFSDQLECVIVEFKLDSATNVQAELVDKLNLANKLAESIAVVMPVLVVDGQEVVPSNKILLETASAIDQKRLRDYLDSSPKTLGEFKVGSLTPYYSVSFWHYELEIDDLHWPPNIFVLANLLDEQDWIKRAQVVFRGLSFPLAISFQIAPEGYPTLGEKRYLIMTAVSDLDIELDQGLLPQLGQGEFYVVESLPEVFFSSEPVEVETTFTKFKRTTVVKWPFWIYAPGDYYFKSVNIPYTNTKIEEKSTVVVGPGWVGVNSIIAGSGIDDIQPLKLYQLKFLAVAVGGDPSRMDVYLGLACISLALIIVTVCVVVWCYQTVANRKLQKENGENGKRKYEDLRLAVANLESISDYHKVEMRLRAVLSSVFGLSYNVQVDELELSALSDDEELRLAITKCLNELEKRQVKDYQPTDEAIKQLTGNLWFIVQKAKGELDGD